MPSEDDFPKDASNFEDFVDANNDGQVTWAEYQQAKKIAKQAINSAGSVVTDGASDALQLVRKYSSDIRTFFSTPLAWLRKYVVPAAFGVVAAILQPFFDVIELVFGGSQPQVFAAPGEIYGLADIPAWGIGVLGDIIAIPVDAGFAIPTTVIRELTVAVPGPFDGAVALVVVGGFGIAAARYGPPLVRAALEAIPVVGGPLSTLLGGPK